MTCRTFINLQTPTKQEDDAQHFQWENQPKQDAQQFQIEIQLDQQHTIKKTVPRNSETRCYQSHVAVESVVEDCVTKSLSLLKTKYAFENLRY